MPKLVQFEMPDELHEEIKRLFQVPVGDMMGTINQLLDMNKFDVTPDCVEAVRAKVKRHKQLRDVKDFMRAADLNDESLRDILDELWDEKQGRKGGQAAVAKKYEAERMLGKDVK